MIIREKDKRSLLEISDKVIKNICRNMGLWK